MSELQKEFEATGYTAWINSDIYPNGRIYTQEYTEWLEAKVAALPTIQPTKYEQLAIDPVAKEVLNELKELNKKSEPVIGDIISILKAEKERAANDMRVHG